MSTLQIKISTIVVVFQHFWRKILWCSTKCLRGFPPLNIFFAQPKVCYLDMTIFIQQQILEFQVSIDNPSLV